MRLRTILLALAAGILIGRPGTAPASPAFDEHGRPGREPSRIAHRAEAPLPSAARPKNHFRIGLDARNAYDADGIFWDGNQYEELRAILESSGATLLPLPSFEAADLDGLTAIVLGQPYAPATTGFSPSERDAIHGFVAGGGRVLACAEAATGSELLIGNLNELVAPWGIRFSDVTSEGAGHAISGIRSHAITANVTSFGVDYQRRIESFTAPAVDLTMGSGPDDFLAVVDAAPGQGCVVLLSDQSSLTDAGAGGDYDLGTLGNAQLLRNVADWFQGQACGGLPPCDAIAALTGPDEACAGELLLLDASGSSIPTCASALEYRWFRDGAPLGTWGPDPLLADTAVADAVHRVEVRCAAEPSCQGAAERSVLVDPGLAPPALPNLLRAWKQDDGILFTWQDTALFGYRLRRHYDARFDRATSEEVVTLSGTFQHFEPGELSRAPWLLFYRVFATSCSGAEER